MVKLLRHRQTKGAETDMFYLRPPRHIFTLPKLAYSGYPNPDKGMAGLSQLLPINVTPKS